MSEIKPRVVEARPSDAALLDRLLELYAYDFSEMLELELTASGHYFPGGWRRSEACERSWLLYAGEHPAGFAVATLGSVIDGRADVWDMREFFVVRRHRRLGQGLYLAHAVWRQQPGTWDVRINQRNRPALAFWQRAASAAGGASIAPRLALNTRTGKQEHLLRFKPDLADSD